MSFPATKKADFKQPKYQKTSNFQTFQFIIVLVTAILISTSISYCQTLTVGVGLIKYQDASNQPVYSFYPEVQLSNHFIDKLAVSFGGNIYWGYWNDGIDDLSRNCADCFTYSYSSHIVGARFEMKLKEFPMPISIFTGISRHFIKANYIGGQDFAGNSGQDFAVRTNSVEVGIWTHIPLQGRFSMRGNFQQYYPFANQNERYKSTVRRTAFGIGLTYSL